MTFTGMRGRLTAMLVLALCLFGGCGGEEQSADETEVRSAVSTALTSTDPKICDTLLTDNYAKQLSAASTAKAARRSCKRDLKDYHARSVDIVNVTVRGESASAVFRPDGGILAFKEGTIALRKSDGTWRLHRLTDATLDRPRFFAVMRKELRSEPEPLDAASTDCTLRAFKDVDDETIVGSYIDNDPSFILTPTALCLLRNELRDKDIPRKVANCVARHFRRSLRGPNRDAIIEGIFGDDSTVFDRVLARTIKRCV